MARTWAAPGRTSGRTGPAPRPAAIKSIFSWLPFYRRAWLPIFRCRVVLRSNTKKRSAGRPAPRFYCVAPRISWCRTPVNFEASGAVEASGLPRGTASPRAHDSSRLMPGRVLLSCMASGSLRGGARALGTSLSVFSTLVTAVFCTRGCSEPCVVLSLNIGGSERLWGLTSSQPGSVPGFDTTALPQPNKPLTSTASQTRNVIESLSPSKRTLLHANKANMAATLNQQAMEHAMASRPAITDSVAPGVISG